MSKHLVMVVNAGSSSLKYQLIDPASGQTHAVGLIERIGPNSTHRHTTATGTVEGARACPDHAVALQIAHDLINEHGPGLDPDDLLAVGHRVVHGGSRFADPVVIDDEVRAAIADLSPLAPLHNPGNLQGIEATTLLFPDVPQVAVFDTAFHQTIPAEAYTYAVPQRWRDELHVRRYGFHGTSLAFVSRRAAELTGDPIEDLKFVVLHLGNGCSACAVDGGRSVETSMGLSPLEGLVMGTRSGDVDPALGAYLSRVGECDQDGYDRALNRESGLLGLAGVSDLREVQARAEAGDEAAELALDVAVHRLVKYIGAYAAVLGRVDGIVLTGGIGEHGTAFRSRLLKRLGLLGVEIDEEVNAATHGEARITTDASRVPVWVIPTNEELEIARQAADVVRAVEDSPGA
jgi:acetate kinase